jgi:hypothetical protein
MRVAREHQNEFAARLVCAFDDRSGVVGSDADVVAGGKWRRERADTRARRRRRSGQGKSWLLQYPREVVAEPESKERWHVPFAARQDVAIPTQTQRERALSPTSTSSSFVSSFIRCSC